MESEEITLNSQLSELSQLTAASEQLKTTVCSSQSLLSELETQRDSELAAIESASRHELTVELQRIQDQATSQLETLTLDHNSRQESIVEQKRLALDHVTSGLNEALVKLNEHQQDETWVVQSVFDETSEHSPVAIFEREADTFVTQKAFLDDRLQKVETRIERTESFLTDCHVGTEQERPAPEVHEKSRSRLRELTVAEADTALSQAETVEDSTLAQWIKGWRLWGFSLTGILILIVPVTAVKAPLRDFFNPEFANPDWQWLAVSAFIALVAVVFVAMTVWLIVQSRLRRGFETMLQHVSNAHAARQLWMEKSNKEHRRLEAAAERWKKEMDARRQSQTEKLKQVVETRIQELRTEAERHRAVIQQDFEARSETFAVQLQGGREQIEAWQASEGSRLRHESNTRLTARRAECVQRFSDTEKQLRAESTAALEGWKQHLADLKSITQLSCDFAASTIQWPLREDGSWIVPQQMPRSMAVGDLLVTVPKPSDNISEFPTANLCVEMPAVLRFPGDTSIVVEHDSAGRDIALGFVRTQLLKLLTLIPAGRIRLTLIDPIGLGQSFSAMMHLADFDELLIHSRIWTDAGQIRDQLQKVTEHMENVFQTYLRSEFQTIEEYNASAGEVAEPYHFVVIAGFPAAFTEESGRHLSSILTSGPRCGVHALVAWNPALNLPPSFDRDDLVNHSTRFLVVGDVVQPWQSFPSSIQFESYREPPAEEFVKIVRAVGEESKDARRVEVSFRRISPRKDEIWSQSTADGIDLPIGRAGAARLQFMRLGRGTSQHALVAGKTGSGKSTLLHILITNLALHYSPDEIQFYLIDFKKGVEFRTYAANKLPHARVVAIESDREFGLSVLERLDEVLQDRGEVFRARGVQDVPSFREMFPSESMPRLLLLIDEFQEFFVAEDRVSSRASLLLDRLIRQGRAFGIHVLLGSQTLGGAYSLARSTLGQVAVRIALQCSESDAHLILSEDNSAARLLTRPGEAIYNDANGLVQGNHPFQIAWLEESEREAAIQQMVRRDDRPRRDHGMVVFEGNVPPTVELCGPLNAQLRSTDDSTRRTFDARTLWLGEPVAIAAPTQIELRRASGQNLLIVGQDESMVDSLLAMTVLSTCCGSRKTAEENARVILLHDGRDLDSKRQFASLQAALQSPQFELKSPTDCGSLIGQLHAEVQRREADAELSTAPEILLLVRNIGQFRELRREEDDYGMGGFGEPKAATVASLFGQIVKQGPLVGVHVIVWSDTFSNAMRWLSNALLREFENRIAFRMNQTDSASLVDTPVAATLVQGRAVLYRDQTGTCDKFRPFAWPSQTWLEAVITGDVTPDNHENDFDIDTLTIE